MFSPPAPPSGAFGSPVPGPPVRGVRRWSVRAGEAGFRVTCLRAKTPQAVPPPAPSSFAKLGPSAKGVPTQNGSFAKMELVMSFPDLSAASGPPGAAPPRPSLAAPSAPEPSTMPVAPPAPFASAEAAWFWTMAVLAARRGLRPPPPLPSSPLPSSPREKPLPPAPRPELVLKCLDTLYRRRQIELLHARILRRWGERGRAPNPARRAERSDYRLWREAMAALSGPLFRAGLIARPAAWGEITETGTASGGEIADVLSPV
jgi:hypothetical protein